MLGMLRAVCAEGDYVALRLILGCRRGVGAARCSQIVQRAVINNLRYSDLFHLPLPGGVFSGPQTTALNRARTVCEALAPFTSADLLSDRSGHLRAMLVEARSEGEAAAWDELTEPLPDGTTLEEVRDYLWADNSEQQRTILSAVHARLRDGSA